MLTCTVIRQNKTA